VNNHSIELSESANEVKNSSEQIAITMQELSSGSETQANHAGRLSEVMVEFTRKVNEANESGKNIATSSSHVLEMSSEGSELMVSTTEQMIQINNRVKNTFDKIQDLDEQSQKINKLVDVIKDIADQTNLLALNAAIEAARAGEHGRGFAVVADEVRKLSVGVAHSVKDITSIVKNIQHEFGNVIESLKDGYTDVEKGTNKMQMTSEKFIQIQSAVTYMVQDMEMITGNLQEMATETKEMNSSIQDIAAISEESAAGIQETSAGTEETSSLMEEVTSSSEQLKIQAGELNKLVNQFKI
jgi:methyl-accepting chemotaxis protein